MNDLEFQKYFKTCREWSNTCSREELQAMIELVKKELRKRELSSQIKPSLDIEKP